MTVAEAFMNAKTVSNKTVDEFVNNFKCDLFRSSKFRGYVSRKIEARAIVDFEHERLIVFRPSWESTRYCVVDYYRIPGDIGCIGG